MSVENPERVVTKQDLKDFYDEIRPYLGGGGGSAGITALTKNVKNTKAQTATFTLSNQRSCYCYPASFGALTSIKDGNNFEYINSYTKTTVSVDGVDYNVYTLTDPVTASGFKQIYA